MATFYEKQLRLRRAVESAEQSFALEKATAYRLGKHAPLRHKCFISYHGADIDPVTSFVEEFNTVFIPRVVGVSDSDNFQDPVNSHDEDYIKSQIGSKYLSDSSVTILFVGACAWARKYIDWELSSSLRNDTVNKRNGLLAITPRDNSVHKLPARFSDNCTNDSSRYARFQYYPTSGTNLRNWIEDAFQARVSRAHLIDNSRNLRTSNSPC